MLNSHFISKDGEYVKTILNKQTRSSHFRLHYRDSWYNFHFKVFFSNTFSIQLFLICKERTTTKKWFATFPFLQMLNITWQFLIKNNPFQIQFYLFKSADYTVDCKDDRFKALGFCFCFVEQWLSFSLIVASFSLSFGRLNCNCNQHSKRRIEGKWNHFEMTRIEWSWWVRLTFVHFSR